MISITKSLAALAVAALASSAFAATTTAPLQVTATVSPACTVSATPMAFGAVNPTGGDVTATSNVSVKCTNGTPYLLNTSVGTGASIANRSMGGTSGNTDRLLYNVYLNSGYTTVADDSGAGRFNGTGGGVTQTYTYYGKLPGGQYVKPDSYLDTLTMTLAY